VRSKQASLEQIAEAKELAANAQQAYVAGKYRVSIDLSEQALKLDPRNRIANNTVAAASCRINEKDRALKAHNAASPEDKKLIRFMCSDAGMTIGQ
jgi:hypothetical protein